MAEKQLYDINHVDMLKMYFGEDYVINEHIKIHQPTVYEIVMFGEKRYYSMLHTFCCIPSDIKSQLWDMGVDYEKISDFELFTLLSRSLQKTETEILFGNFDFSALEVARNNSNDEIVLADFNKGVVVDKLIYQRIVDYLRKMNGLTAKIEHAANAYTKKVLIEQDRLDKELAAKKEYSSVLLSLVSALCNSPEFKYRRDELNKVGIVEFMDSVRRIPIIKNSDALLKGCYSGMLDVSKINTKKELNWMRGLDE